MKKHLINLLILFLSTSAYSGDNCYELGYKYGLCSTKSLYGINCNPKNDIVIPPSCRGKSETKKGIEKGVKTVYEVLNLN